MLTVVLDFLCSQRCFGVPDGYHDTLDEQSDYLGKRFHRDAAEQQ